MNDEEPEESNEEILQVALNAAIKAFNEAVSDYDLSIGYDFKVMLFPTYQEGDKTGTPMLEFSANNRGNFV